MKEAYLKQSIEEGIADLQAGKVSDGKSRPWYGTRESIQGAI